MNETHEQPEASHVNARPPESAPHLYAKLRFLTLVYWIGLFVATHWPKLELLGPLDPNNLWQVDKASHVVGFGLLTALLAWARPLGGRMPWRITVLVALLLAGGYALFDEWSQQFVDRIVSHTDVLASLIGVGSAAVLLLQPARGPERANWFTISVRVFVLLFLPTVLVVALFPSGSRMFVTVVRDTYGTYASGTDKNGHLIVGIMGTWLLATAALGGVRRPRLGAAITLLIMGLTGPVLEEVQSRTGRNVELADMYMHNLGLAWALAGWVLWLLVKPMVSKLSGTPDKATSAVAGSSGSHHFVGHAVVVGVLTFLSRLTGLLRDAVLAAVLGLGAVTDAFFIGFLVPNLFRRLFGEGALSAAFIPHYTRLLERDPTIAKRFAGVCVAGLVVLLSAITILGELILAGMLWGGDWTAETSLAIRLTMVMLPYMPLICLVALIGGVLQVHHKFGAPAAVPVLLNFAIIGFALAAAGYYGDPNDKTPIAFVVSVGVLVAGVMQLVWQVVALLRVTSLSMMWADTGPELRSMLRMMGPMVIGLAVFQINAFFDSLIAFGLSAKPGAETMGLFGHTVTLPIEVGGVGALQWAQRLYQFPLGVFGIAIATAIFPALARSAANRDTAPYRRILRHGLRLTVFIGLPASVGLLLVRDPLTSVVFERYAFTAEDVTRVASILMGYSVSVWAYSMTHVLTRAYYAKHDAKTPLKISMGMVAFNLALNLILIWPLGVAGLAWSSAISAVGQVILLLIFIRKHVDHAIDPSVLAGWARTVALTIVMGGAVWLYLDMTAEWAYDFWRRAVILLSAVSLGGVIVLGGAWVTRAEELKWLKRNR